MVYILAASRTFSSNWNGVSQMIPFADQLNHENVNCTYDCRDKKSGVLIKTPAEIEHEIEKEKRLAAFEL